MSCIDSSSDTRAENIQLGSKLDVGKLEIEELEGEQINVAIKALWRQ